MSELLLILLPGTMYFWVLFIGQGPMQEVLQDKESHLLARILAAPVTLPQFLLSKMLRCFVLCSLALTALVLSSAVLFGIHWGHPLVVAVVIVACALAMTGTLAGIYALARTREQANVISSVCLIVLAMIGGGMFPFEDLPGFLQAIGQWTPNRWSVLALQGAANSKPLAEILAPLSGLIAVGIVGIISGLVLFERQLGQGQPK